MEPELSSVMGLIREVLSARRRIAWFIDHLKKNGARLKANPKIFKLTFLL
jgi:hypothetical protein